jgi:hypothetical protein
MKKLPFFSRAIATYGVAWCLSANAVVLGPSSYVKAADSPFTGLGFSYFHLEDWEDNALNVPGVTMTATSPLLSSSFGAGLIDSVDEDDGLINGFSHNGAGHYGQAQWAVGDPGIVFAFSAGVLGTLPTHVGIVWTDGAGTINFEAFDSSGNSLGALVGTHANGSFGGESAEDRFYGVINASGVSKIHIYNTAGGIEVDHLQYGALRTSAGVPEVFSTLGAFVASCLGLLALKHRSRQ